MSTLNVSNITDGTTTVGTSYVVNGSAKAWANWNGTGTIAARDSLNLSSLTDNGTGKYTTNFSSAFANANYSTVSGVSYIDAGGNNGALNVLDGTGLSTGSAPYIMQSGNGVNEDWSYNFTSNFGDLA